MKKQSDIKNTANPAPENIRASDAPVAPGCYLMKDAREKVIYVGKARNLRARIRSYLNETDSRYTVKFLMRKVAHIEYLVTANEKEALLLENSLIKQYHPRYNVRLKDDKTYLSLRLDTREDFPRITVVRRYRRDGAQYFGPYHDTGAIRKTLRQLQRMFPLRTCSDHVLNNRARPCLYYQMKQCLAPCVGYVTRDQYHNIVEEVLLILQGKSADLEAKLLQEIQEHSEALRFEEAAALRDRLYDLRRTMERQRTVGVKGAEDRDVFGLYAEGRFVEIQALFYRGGKLLGGRAFSFERCEVPHDELLSSFLLQYYSEAPMIPKEVLSPLDFDDRDTLSELLTENRNEKVRIHAPQRGELRALVKLAEHNAKRSFEEKRLTQKAQKDALEETRKALHLPQLPYRIECFDISTTQGRQTVASMVTFTGGKADKARYRRYAMRDVEGQDDFASMREVMMRRYTRAIREDDLPDLILIDGGKGQLNSASAVLQDLGIEDIPHVGIAKSRIEASGHSPERFFTPGRKNPIILPQNGPVVQLMARIRDEAHRFAITFHRKKRTKATLSTTLTAIPGVGPTLARRLLKHLGSVAKIKTASTPDLQAVPGISKHLAEVIHEYFKKSC